MLVIMINFLTRRLYLKTLFNTILNNIEISESKSLCVDFYMVE